jgi:hypothetical protein
VAQAIASPEVRPHNVVHADHSNPRSRPLMKSRNCRGPTPVPSRPSYHRLMLRSFSSTGTQDSLSLLLTAFCARYVTKLARHVQQSEM